MPLFKNSLMPFIRSISIGRADKQIRIFVEIIPSKITDIVSKPLIHSADRSGAINNTCGFKSSHDAIIEAQRIGFSLLSYVKPENLFFVFSETLESLQSALREFCSRHFVSYPSGNCYGPIYTEQNKRYDKNESDPLAIVLCKVINADLFQPAIWAKQQKGSDYSKRYEVSWSELQDLQKSFNNFIEHN